MECHLWCHCLCSPVWRWGRWQRRGWRERAWRYCWPPLQQGAAMWNMGMCCYWPGLMKERSSGKEEFHAFEIINRHASIYYSVLIFSCIHSTWNCTDVWCMYWCMFSHTVVCENMHHHPVCSLSFHVPVFLILCTDWHKMHFVAVCRNTFIFLTIFIII